MRTLFGIEQEKENQIIEVNIYSDEVKNIVDPETKEKWHYIGLIVIPVQKEEVCLNNLLKARFFENFSPENDLSLVKKDEYFKKNNRIVHFSDLDADTFYIAKRWHSYLKNKCSEKEFYFNILGICESRLSQRFFPRKEFIVVYNRFFRSAIAFALKKFFLKKNVKKIIIKEIFHEKGEQQFNSLFPWHAIYKINKEENWPIYCKKKKITFIGKDHEKNKRANFIQFIDVLLGVTRNAIHYTSKGKFQKRLTEEYFPLIKRLIYKPNNPNSKTYPSYHRRMNIDFFPKEKLTSADQLSRYKKMFYKKVKLNFEYRGQKKLL